MVTLSFSLLFSSRGESQEHSLVDLMMSSPSKSAAAKTGQSSSAVASSNNADESHHTTSVTKVLKVVWDFEKIEKLGGPDESTKKWRCNWCGLTLKGWNATKALSHVTKSPGNNDVKTRSGNIPKDTLASFQRFRYKKMGVASVKRTHADEYTEKIASQQMSLSIMYQDNRIRSSASSNANPAFVVNCDEGGVGATNATKLTSAIAEYIYCKGLPFSAAEGDHFMQIIKLAHLVGSSYHPPNRCLVSTELLDISYKNRHARYLTDLNTDADIYGLSLFGDGATVHGMPLINILAAGVGEPSAVLEIVDCKLFCEFSLFLKDFKLTLCLLLFSIFGLTMHNS